MKTPEEKLRDIAPFKLLQNGEIDIDQAVAPFTAQLAQLERDRSDFSAEAYERRKTTIQERARTAAAEVMKRWEETKVLPFQKAHGRSKPGRIPPKDTARAGLLIQSAAAMSPVGGGELLQEFVERAEENKDDQESRALIGVILPIVRDRLASAPIADGDLAIGEVNAVTAMITRAEKTLIDDQVLIGRAGEELVKSLRSQMNDVLDAVNRTGSVVDRTQAISPSGDIVERPRRPDLAPATGVKPPEPQKGVDVYLTPIQAANEKIYADSTQLATEQGGRVIIQELKP